MWRSFNNCDQIPERKFINPTSSTPHDTTSTPTAAPTYNTCSMTLRARPQVVAPLSQPRRTGGRHHPARITSPRLLLPGSTVRVRSALPAVHTGTAVRKEREVPPGEWTPS